MTAKEFFDLMYKPHIKEAQLFTEKFPQWYNYLETLKVVPWKQDYLEKGHVLPKRVEIDVQNIGERVDEILPTLLPIFIPETGACYFPKAGEIAFYSETPSFLTFLSETGKLFFSAKDDVWYVEKGGAMFLVLLILSGELELNNNEVAILHFLEYLHSASARSLRQQEVDALEFTISSLLDKSLSSPLNMLFLEGLADMGVPAAIINEYRQEKSEIGDHEVKQFEILLFLKLLIILAARSKKWKSFLVKLLTEEPVVLSQKEEGF